MNFNQNCPKKPSNLIKTTTSSVFLCLGIIEVVLGQNIVNNYKILCKVTNWTYWCWKLANAFLILRKMRACRALWGLTLDQWTMNRSKGVVTLPMPHEAPGSSQTAHQRRDRRWAHPSENSAKVHQPIVIQTKILTPVLLLLPHKTSWI